VTKSEVFIEVEARLREAFGLIYDNVHKPGGKLNSSANCNPVLDAIARASREAEKLGIELRSSEIGKASK
jgi:hypothetical protein